MGAAMASGALQPHLRQAETKDVGNSNPVEERTDDHTRILNCTSIEFPFGTCHEQNDCRRLMKDLTVPGLLGLEQDIMNRTIGITVRGKQEEV
jgi:hypothetical protein